jgi:hypothetical protein
MSALPREKEIGLLGELWFLKLLTQLAGDRSVGAWTAPDDEAHDFRLGSLEIEVKTTTSNERVHWIHGLGQLEPSPEADLRLLSVHLTSPGIDAGFSLSSLVQDLRSTFRDMGQEDLFMTRFQAYTGLPPGDEIQYTRRYKHRSPAALMSVGQAGFPKLLAKDLQDIPRDGLDRIVRVDYAIGVDGLGVSEGSTEFIDILAGHLA